MRVTTIMTHSVDSPCQFRLKTERRLGKPEHCGELWTPEVPSDSVGTSKKRNLGRLPVYVDSLMFPSERSLIPWGSHHVCWPCCNEAET